VDEAIALLDEGTPFTRRAGDVLMLVWMLSARGLLARYRLDFETEVRLAGEARELAREQGNRGAVVFGQVCGGISLAHLGQYDEALDSMEKGLRGTREQGVPGADAEVLGLLVWVSHLKGDGDRMLRYVPEALESARRLKDPVTLAQNLEMIVPPLLEAGRPLPAARIIGYSDRQRAESGRRTPPPNVEAWASQRTEAERALGDGYEAARSAGEEMGFDEALELGYEGSAILAG
jgi:hypothetical protein